MGLGPDWYQQNVYAKRSSCPKFTELCPHLSKIYPQILMLKMEPMEFKVLKCKHEIYY